MGVATLTRPAAQPFRATVALAPQRFRRSTCRAAGTTAKRPGAPTTKGQAREYDAPGARKLQGQQSEDPLQCNPSNDRPMHGGACVPTSTAACGAAPGT